ncbi:MAG: Ty1/Copia family ribonuclease HI [Deltaproteobacteria bacterium]|nr:Ty1/Copia family ribonuclease HI [Deltaproteobacteria bacterium]
MKRIFRYLVGTASHGLHYRRSSSVQEGSPLLVGFSDSDWGGDIQGRRSTSGCVCFIAGSPVSWSSRKQSVVALSTMEAEYIALASVAREMMSLRALLLEVGLQVSDALVFCDNSPALFLASNPVVTPRSKHIDIRYHFLRDLCERQLLTLKWIPSAAQVADILTKYLNRELFLRCRDKLIQEQES